MSDVGPDAKTLTALHPTDHPRPEPVTPEQRDALYDAGLGGWRYDGSKLRAYPAPPGLTPATLPEDGLYASKKAALIALRHELQEEYALKLAAIDADIERLVNPDPDKQLTIRPVLGAELTEQVALLHEKLEDILVYPGFTINRDQFEIVPEQMAGRIMIKVGGEAFARLTRRSNGTLTGWLGVRADAQSQALEASIPELNLTMEGQFALDAETCLKEVLRTSAAAQRVREMHGNRNPGYLEYGLQEKHRVEPENVEPGIVERPIERRRPR